MSSEKLRQGSDYNLERLWKPLACSGQFLKIAAVSSATNGTRPDLAVGGAAVPRLFAAAADETRSWRLQRRWMQIGSLRGGLHVWSETKIITGLLVTMSLALPLSFAWCFLPVPPSTFFSPTFLPPLLLSHYSVDNISGFLSEFPACSHLQFRIGLKASKCVIIYF